LTQDGFKELTRDLRSILNDGKNKK